MTLQISEFMNILLIPPLITTTSNPTHHVYSSQELLANPTTKQSEAPATESYKQCSA